VKNATQEAVRETKYLGRTYVLCTGYLFIVFGEESEDFLYGYEKMATKPEITKRLYHKVAST